MGNRVEDLERQVSELQAAVEGVTEELVETKERLRELEDEAVTDADANARSDSDSNAAAGSAADAGPASGGSAGTRAEPEAEADKTDEGVDGDDGEESGDSDIIVA